MKAKQMADTFVREGNMQMAQRKYAESIDITPQIAYEFITALRKLEVEYYVAPYEADAQLAYLYLTKKVQMVITEDSDLLVFGVKKVFFKMDRAGNGFEVDLDRIGEVDDEVDFRTFTHDMFMTCCIISGCDYIDSIKGVGFKKAFRLVYENGDDLKNIVKKIRREGKLLIPQDYEKNFEKAFLTFKFQYVFCPEKRQLIHLNDPLEHPMGKLLSNYQTKDFLGEEMDPDMTLSIARGHVDPGSKQPYDLLMKDWQASNKAAIAEEEKTVIQNNFQKSQSHKFVNPPLFSRHDAKAQPESNSGLLNFFKRQTSCIVSSNGAASVTGTSNTSTTYEKKEVKVTTVTSSNLTAFRLKSNQQVIRQNKEPPKVQQAPAPIVAGGSTDDSTPMKQSATTEAIPEAENTLNPKKRKFDEMSQNDLRDMANESEDISVVEQPRKVFKRCSDYIAAKTAEISKPLTSNDLAKYQFGSTSVDNLEIPEILSPPTKDELLDTS